MYTLKPPRHNCVSALASLYPGLHRSSVSFVSPSASMSLSGLCVESIRTPHLALTWPVPLEDRSCLTVSHSQTLASAYLCSYFLSINPFHRHILHLSALALPSRHLHTPFSGIHAPSSSRLSPTHLCAFLSALRTSNSVMVLCTVF